MIPYKNIAGNSGVIAYDTGPDFLIVEFINGSVYRYDYGSNGKEVIEGMKLLAEAGQGLSTFISRYVRDYAERLR